MGELNVTHAQRWLDTLTQGDAGTRTLVLVSSGRGDDSSSLAAPALELIVQ